MQGGKIGDIDTDLLNGDPFHAVGERGEGAIGHLGRGDTGDDQVSSNHECSFDIPRHIIAYFPIKDYLLNISLIQMSIATR